MRNTCMAWRFFQVAACLPKPILPSLSGPSFLPLSCVLSENRWPSSKGGFSLLLHTVAGDTQPFTQLPWCASHSYGLCYQIFDYTTKEILVSVEESLTAPPRNSCFPISFAPPPGNSPSERVALLLVWVSTNQRAVSIILTRTDF